MSAPATLIEATTRGVVRGVVIWLVPAGFMVATWFGSWLPIGGLA